MIYLDNAATTKPKQEVINAITPYLTEKWYNPSSLYNGSINVKKDIEAARRTIANFINAEPAEIYFTSGASESNSWVLQGFAKEHNEAIIISTPIEHKSILSCMDDMENTLYVYVDNYGLLKLDNLESYLQGFENIIKTKGCLVSVGMANNEIGTIQNIKKISNLVHRYKAVLHTDATQTFGKIPINVKEMGIDMMSASGHKIGGIKGCGFLYVKNGIKISPIIYGSQEQELRGGTENVTGIIGLAKAVSLCNMCLEDIQMKCDVRDGIIHRFKNDFGCTLNGHPKHRLPDNINITFPQNITGEALLHTLDLSDIKISVGSACNSYSIEPSHVLKAIGLSDEEAARTVRITLPDIFEYTYYEYADMVNKIFKEIHKAIKIIEA